MISQQCHLICAPFSNWISPPSVCSVYLFSPIFVSFAFDFFLFFLNLYYCIWILHFITCLFHLSLGLYSHAPLPVLGGDIIFFSWLARYKYLSLLNRNALGAYCVLRISLKDGASDDTVFYLVHCIKRRNCIGNISLLLLNLSLVRCFTALL